VPVSRSVQRDYIVCLEDGKKLKMLKRYLRTHYDMSPEEYRRKWSLPGDYPMVAPAYAERRSDFAKSIGLGKGKMRGRVDSSKTLVRTVAGVSPRSTSGQVTAWAMKPSSTARASERSPSPLRR
jgi:hypothetical protein